MGTDVSMVHVSRKTICEDDYWRCVHDNLWQDLCDASNGYSNYSSSGADMVFMCGKDKTTLHCHEPIVKQCSSFLTEVLNRDEIPKCCVKTVVLPDVSSKALSHCLR